MQKIMNKRLKEVKKMINTSDRWYIEHILEYNWDKEEEEYNTWVGPVEEDYDPAWGAESCRNEYDDPEEFWAAVLSLHRFNIVPVCS